MIGLSIAFLAGRFHATPWDRAVNEGEVEWPPSPWRLLRAITAGWYALGAPDQETFACLISALAEPPRYVLPPSTASHTRHYMPQGRSGESTTLVLDAFNAFRDRNAEAFVFWDAATLDDGRLRLLRDCCALISYLGRAESWCAVRVLESGDAVEADRDAVHVDLASRFDGEGPLVRRLGIDSNTRGRGLVHTLSVETGALRKARRLVPEGTVWLDYRFPPAFGRDRVRALRELQERTFTSRRERFVLQGPGRERQLRPSVQDTIAIAEAFRRAVMGIEGRANEGRVDPAFSGKVPDGQPALGHEHAFFLPKDIDHDGFIDHVDVWIPGRLGHAGYRALVGVQRLYDRGLGLADGEHYTVAHLGEAPRTMARRWRSSTPFVLPRHQKQRGPADAPRVLDDPEAQLHRALAHHGFGAGELLTWERGRDAKVMHVGGRATLAEAYRTARRNEREHAEAITATIEFELPMVGPIVLGKHAHFGMGQFEPVNELSAAAG